MTNPIVDSDRLLFGVPKKGRLYEKIVKLLEGAGLEYHRPNRVDIAQCLSLPVTIVFLPASDIAKYVGEGNVDLGITGQDIIAESETTVNQLELLGFGKCKLAVQTPVKDNVNDPKILAGKRIVTSFPKIAKDYFKKFENGNPTNIKYVSGSVEAACGLGLADGIVDLVETGTTMKAAGLEMISIIMETQAVLIANPHTKHPKLIEKIHKRIIGYKTANNYRMISYNIHRDSLVEARKLTPGRKAPTINSLDCDEKNSEYKGFVAVSAMIEKKSVSHVMDQLYDIGASDIIVFNMENCRV